MRCLHDNEILTAGTQVLYVPAHVSQRYLPSIYNSHPETEVGFVWEDQGDKVSVRYFRKKEGGLQLRTTAGSEITPKRYLYVLTSNDPTWRDPSIIEKAIKRIIKQKEE